VVQLELFWGHLKQMKKIFSNISQGQIYKMY
jgi:hypothetical protein